MNTAGRILAIAAAFALVGAVALGTGPAILTAQAGVLPSDAHTVLVDHFNRDTVGTAYGPLSYAPSLYGLGRAAVFGPDTYVKYAMAPSTTNAGTVEMWIKPSTGLTTNTGLLNFNWNDTGQPPPDGWVLQMGITSASTVPPNVPYGSTATGTSSVPLHQWSHVALTWSPTSTDLYLDGVLTGSGAGSPPSIAQNYWVYLNYWGTAASGPFVGLIDELRISDIDRSAAEIAADAAAPAPPPPPGPGPAGGAATAYYNIGGPSGIVTGPDGNLWFTNASNDTIGKITPAGAVTIYTGPDIAQPSGIASDGTSLWFTNNGFGGGDTIGRVDPDTGQITSYTSSGIRALRGITLGPDGAMWFTSHGAPAIGRITSDGTITSYTDAGMQGPEGITAGSDGGLWFTDDSGNIGRIDPVTHEITFRDLTGSGIVGPRSIVSGPDGQLWFTDVGTQDESGNQVDASIGHMSTTTDSHGYYADAGIVSPAGIAVGPDGKLWFTNQSVATDCPPCGTTPTIGRISTAGVISQPFTDASLDQPQGITSGPDGAVWFTNSGAGNGASIGRVTTGGSVSNYKGNGMYAPQGIVSGPDGALWFANSGGGTGNPSYSSIGRLTTDGAITYFSDPANVSQPSDMIVGPDGNLWFTNNGWGGGDMIGRITPGGAITSYSSPDIGPVGITNGPDGAMWFASPGGMRGGPAIGRITTAGTITTITDSRLASPEAIATGPDGALWFTNGSGQIGRVTTGGSFSFFTDSRIQNPKGIVAGPGGALWFTNSGTYDDQGNLIGGSSIGSITPSGRLRFYTGTSIVSPDAITLGPDGALWFTTMGAIGRINMAGIATSYPAVGVSGQPVGITTGPDGAMWFTELNNVIGRIDTAVTPEITGFTPVAGPVGTKVSITGVNLARASRVTFGGTPAAIVLNTSGRIVVRVPAGAVSGQISVTTSVGTATSSSMFTVS